MSTISNHQSQASGRIASVMASNKPSMPADSKQPILEKRIADPSSSLPREQRYPIPSFFEYRVRPKEADVL
jgi:hypothetical protein